MLLVFKDLKRGAGAQGCKRLLNQGRLPISRINDAVARVLRAKARVGLHRQNGQVSLDALTKDFGTPEFRRVAADIADRGITLLRDARKQLPLDATRPRRALLVAVASDPDRCPAEELEKELRRRVDALQVLRADTRYASIDELQLPPVGSYDLLIVALFVRVATSGGHVGLPFRIKRNSCASFADNGQANCRSRFRESLSDCRISPKRPTWIAAFSTSDVAQAGLRAAAMFGQIPISGKIPVNVPGTVALGSGIEVPASTQ